MLNTFFFMYISKKQEQTTIPIVTGLSGMRLLSTIYSRGMYGQNFNMIPQDLTPF